MAAMAGHEHARVVNERVHLAETFERLIDQARAGLGVGDIAGHGEHAGVGGGGDVPRVRDDRVPELAVGLHGTGADALRRAGDNRDLLSWNHDCAPDRLPCGGGTVSERVRA
jgi:hypothetical protein